MRNKNLLFLICSFLITASLNAEVLCDTDTIIVKPFVKKKKPYPLQPLVLKTSPTGFMWGGAFPFTSEYRFTAEITSGRTQSEQVSISVLSKNVFWKLIETATKVSAGDQLKVSGWRVQYMHKIYLVNRRHHAPYGFYVGPHFSYTNAKVAVGLSRYYHQVYFDLRHFNANLVIGVQAGKLGRLTLDICGGLGYKTNKVYYHASSVRIIPYDTEEFGEFYNNNLHLMFDLSLGYSF
ncbi:MAG TPA: hypothetical protein VGC65_12520 [Bacteroidia bacterium]|jgi:hypothetical protein